jgi:hypothetical protein
MSSLASADPAMTFRMASRNDGMTRNHGMVGGLVEEDEVVQRDLVTIQSNADEGTATRGRRPCPKARPSSGLTTREELTMG